MPQMTRAEEQEFLERIAATVDVETEEAVLLQAILDYGLAIVRESIARLRHEYHARRVSATKESRRSASDPGDPSLSFEEYMRQLGPRLISKDQNERFEGLFLIHGIGWYPGYGTGPNPSDVRFRECMDLLCAQLNSLEEFAVYGVYRYGQPWHWVYGHGIYLRAE